MTPYFLEFRHDVTADGAGLYAGQHVVAIDPEDAIHAAHVDRDDGAPFVRETSQRVGDVGPATVRDQGRCVLFREFDEFRDLLFGFRIDDDVGNAAELCVLDRVHLFLGVAVAVAHADLTIRVDLRRREKTLEGRQKFSRQDRFRNYSRITRRVDLPRIEIDFQNLANPGQKTGKLLATQFVASPANDDVAVFADVKVGVAKSPHIEALRFTLSRRGLRLRDDQGTFGWTGLAECFCGTQTAILRENNAFSKMVEQDGRTEPSGLA